MSSKPQNAFKRFILQIIVWLILWCTTGFIAGSQAGGHVSLLVPVLFSVAGVICGFTYALIILVLASNASDVAIVRKKKSLSIYLNSLVTGAVSALVIMPYFFDDSGSVDGIVIFVLFLMGGISGLVAAVVTIK